ncbi:MAG: bacillithiol system redox-active protein YtxJ [Ferruginibacter sp.]|nr:bacillithiol system redox-active protein YtxJ [Ferruginibacter sp.]
MNWIHLDSLGQLDQIKQLSYNKPQVIFKHSTRCSISTIAKNRLEQSEHPANVDFYYLDLLAFRSISQTVAEMFKVYHESPQVLLIKNGECVYDESHNGVNMDELKAEI